MLAQVMDAFAQFRSRHCQLELESKCAEQGEQQLGPASSRAPEAGRGSAGGAALEGKEEGARGALWWQVRWSGGAYAHALISLLQHHAGRAVHRLNVAGWWAQRVHMGAAGPVAVPVVVLHQTTPTHLPIWRLNEAMHGCALAPCRASPWRRQHQHPLAWQRRRTEWKALSAPPPGRRTGPRAGRRWQCA